MRLAIACLALLGCGSDADDWAGIRNPVVRYEDRAVKDAFAIVDDTGTWRFGYSEIEESPFRFRLGFTSSPDLVTFTRGETIDQPTTGGLASPSVTRAPDGTYVMVYNSHTRDEGDTANKLYYRTSTDAVSWSEPHRIHITGADADTDRLIDAALAHTETGLFLAFKREQTANIAHAPSGSLDGPWTLLGELFPSNLENYQLLQLDGVWHLLGTTIPLVHEPALHRLAGDPSHPASWRTWTHVSTFEIEPQAWNTGAFLDHEVANAAFLVDRREHDGYAYLVYAGSTDLTSYELRGHCKLGISRSRDLTSWEPAPTR